MWNMDKIRNIGMMAHIDAGKTTTTERMLFYSGYTNHLGEVHTGDTVMDYMDQERDRGITITAAAITLPWKKHQLNLIDTPGHVDFTMEVERSLRVTDGAVLILDGSAGVQAQTLTVWRQAIRNKVNRIAYINKLDKPAGDVQATINSLKTRLNITPLLTQMPLGEGKEMYGLVDLVDLSAYVWDKSSNQGKLFSKLDETQLKTTMFNAWKEASALRSDLIEQCCDFDNLIADEVILSERFDSVTPKMLRDGLRRITLNQDSGALVTCLGSSYKNIGVQPLMDAIVQYLPSPQDKSYPFLRYYGGKLCGLVFKIIHHPQKGVLSFVRIYSGQLSANSSVYNVTKQQSDKVGKLMVAFADDFREVGEVTAGNIAVIAGLKLSMTGDTVVESQSVARTAAKAAGHTAADGGEDDHVSAALLAAPFIPEPVFFCSVEPPSMAAQKQFDIALDCISREDPSLRVSQDPETGQTVLGGMGELHLEIVVDRMKTGWKVETEIGKLQVAYRELPCTPATLEEKFERKMADKSHSIQLDISVQPNTGQGKSEVLWSRNKEAVEIFKIIRPQFKKAVVNGLKSGFDSGPLLGYPILDCTVTINNLQIGRGTSLPMISAGASYILKQLLKMSDVRLAEPVMTVEIVCEEDVVDNVLQDLSRRRGEVDYSQARQGAGSQFSGLATIKGGVPLGELKGYSSHLRTITSGKANLSMELSHYQLMTEYEQDQAIEDVTGFKPN